jgi:hypothetical protein
MLDWTMDRWGLEPNSDWVRKHLTVALRENVGSHALRTARNGNVHLSRFDNYQSERGFDRLALVKVLYGSET